MPRHLGQVFGSRTREGKTKPYFAREKVGRTYNVKLFCQQVAKICHLDISLLSLESRLWIGLPSELAAFLLELATFLFYLIHRHSRVEECLVFFICRFVECFWHVFEKLE